MVFFIVSLIGSLVLNLALAVYFYKTQTQIEDKIDVPMEKRLTAENIAWLIALVRQEVKSLRVGHILQETSDTVLDWDIITTKLMYLHADTTEEDGGIIRDWRLSDLTSLPDYTEEELDDLYDRRSKNES